MENSISTQGKCVMKRRTMGGRSSGDKYVLLLLSDHVSGSDYFFLGNKCIVGEK